jgi:hypothetical protein
MNNNQTQINKQIPVDPRKYLVTQQADVQNFSKQKINKDLEVIKRAESRAKQRLGITRGKENDPATRAMAALRLINPFKGV